MACRCTFSKILRCSNYETHPHEITFNISCKVRLVDLRKLFVSIHSRNLNQLTIVKGRKVEARARRRLLVKLWPPVEATCGTLSPCVAVPEDMSTPCFQAV